MKRILLATLLGAAAFSAGAANVGVSINIGDPNFYGSIDIGNYPKPQLVYPRPVVIQPSVGVELAPLYLHVPYEHSHNWHRYCGTYNACGRPVYFVHEDWYQHEYAPRYRNEHMERHEERRDERDWRHDERRDERRDEHHDNGRHDERRDHDHRDGEGR